MAVAQLFTSENYNRRFGGEKGVNQDIGGKSMGSAGRLRALSFTFLSTSIGVLVLAFGAFTQLAAQEVSEGYFFDEVPVVLSVTRLRQPLTDTPASVTVIDKEMIRASGATNIPDLLRHVPGFQVAFVTGMRATVTAHGRGDEYSRDMQVIIDGRSIYDPAFGGVSWQDLQLDLESIQRIEVVHGPNAASYGSNSFAGVINILTKHPAEQQGILVKTLVGEGQNRQHYGRYAGSVGNLDFRIAAGRSEHDGFDTRVDSEKTNWFSVRGDYQADTFNRLQLQFGHSQGPRDEGFVGDTLQPARVVDHINHYQQLRWNRLISPEEELQLQFYHNYQKKDDHFEVDLPPAVVGGFGFVSHRYDLEMQYTNRFSDSFRLVAGIGGRYESADGFWTFGELTPSRNQLRTFANAEWQVDDATVLNIGGMYEIFQGKRGLFSPRVALNYSLNPSNMLRFAVSRAYRMPTLWEDNSNLLAYLASNLMPLDYVFRTLENLEPEQITAFEIGYLGNFPELALQFDVRLFKERIRNIIPNIEDQRILGPVNVEPGAQSYINGGSIDTNGVELDLNFRPVRRSRIHIGYSLMNAYGKQIKRIRSDNSLQIPIIGDTVPRQTFSLLASHLFKSGLEVSGSFHYIDPIRWLYDGDRVPKQTRLDLRVGKIFRRSNLDIDLNLIFQNIDGKDIDFYDSPGRNQINIADKRIMFQAGLLFH